jgi:hypothetical protein
MSTSSTEHPTNDLAFIARREQNRKENEAFGARFVQSQKRPRRSEIGIKWSSILDQIMVLHSKFVSPRPENLKHIGNLGEASAEFCKVEIVFSQ